MKKTPKKLIPKKPAPNMWSASPDSVKKISMKNEARLGKELGFRPTPGSGNTPWASKKGDGEHEIFMFEIKETKTSSLSINKQAVEKLCREAAVAGKKPAIILSVHGIAEHLPSEWVCFPLEVAQEMLERLKL